MARINLLPWRAERRQQRQKQFAFMMLGAAVLGVLISWGVVFYYDQQIDSQKQRNAYLDGEIKKLDQQIKEIEGLETTKERLLTRKSVIEQLQANRSQMVHLLDELVRTIPDGVQLTSLKQNGQELRLEGKTQSNARVSSYMRSLEESGWMQKPDLKVIEAKGNDKSLPYIFSLTVKLTKPGASGGEDGEADGGDQ